MPKFEQPPEMKPEEKPEEEFKKGEGTKKESPDLREDPKMFLEFEQSTQPNEEIKEMAEGLRGKTEHETLENVLSFLGENLKPVDLEKENPKEWKKLFRKRSVEEILESKNSYGCSEIASAFATLMRICEIPTKFIEGKRIGKSGGHSWAEVFISGKWVTVDPTQGIDGIEFKPEESKHGPYKIISESLGTSDSLISSYKDWRKVEKLWDYKKSEFKKEIKNEKELTK